MTIWIFRGENLAVFSGRSYNLLCATSRGNIISSTSPPILGSKRRPDLIREMPHGRPRSAAAHACR